MIETDIEAGMRLKTQANWNQTPADWQRFLALQPDGCFLAESDHGVVGTITTCVFGCVGWIGMLLVDERYRGRGIGTRLMERAMCFLRETGASRMRLDATEAGHPLHQKMGFRTQYHVVRFAGVPVVPVDAVSRVQARAYRIADLPGLLSLDRTYTNVNRSRLLARLVEEPTIATRVVGESEDVRGFLIERRGSEACCKSVQRLPVATRLDRHCCLTVSNVMRGTSCTSISRRTTKKRSTSRAWSVSGRNANSLACVLDNRATSGLMACGRAADRRKARAPPAQTR